MIWSFRIVSGTCEVKESTVTEANAEVTLNRLD